MARAPCTILTGAHAQFPERRPVPSRRALHAPHTPNSMRLHSDLHLFSI
ncbi:unnamed protein product [Staurois parvus]|uniref:Uncharacterized protein n=1 Tax=Staurois parvus TaxID=386267 RepID=A0ABN9AT91_9NEOB|nr:unnamed protein product [Staurois parvus]